MGTLFTVNGFQTEAYIELLRLSALTSREDDMPEFAPSLEENATLCC